MTQGRRRVVHVVRSDSFAGVERYICNIAHEFVQRNWDVSVVGGEAAAMQAGLPRGTRHMEASTTFAVGAALRRLERPDVIHAHMTAAELAAVISRGHRRTPIVATRHFARRRGGGRATATIGRLLARGIALEIAISQYVAEHVEGHPAVLLNGVPDDDNTVDEDAKAILVLQRLQPEKDTATALRAFALTALASAGWQLHVGGRGSEHAALQALTAQLGLSAAVRFHGFVDPAVARAGAAIFLATAPCEPFGLSLAEAMAAGLPVVASSGGAHPEVLGAAGLLFPSGDIAACAQQLRALADDSGMRRRLGERGRQRQRKSLSMTVHAERLEELYRTVTVGRHASGR